MQIIKQDDFDSFKCIADKCPSSCCVGWQIVIDEESLDKYARIEGNFKGKIDRAVDFEEGVFIQNNRRCAMLRDDDLCEIHCCLGEESLCYTCKQFPRHEEEFEDIRELSLSMSCPEVARTVVSRTEPYHFVEEENDEIDDFEDFDYLLYTKLVDAREIAYKIVQNRGLPIQKRMDLVLELSKQLQKCIDEDRIFDMDDVIAEYDSDRSESYKDDEETVTCESIDILYSLEVLNADWIDILEKTSEKIKNGGEIRINNSEIIATEQILVLLIYTYFCGAVYDDWIYSKMALCVRSVQWILLIYKSTDMSLDKVLYKYSKEIEHSDLNLNALEEYFMEKY